MRALLPLVAALLGAAGAFAEPPATTPEARRTLDKLLREAERSSARGYVGRAAELYQGALQTLRPELGPDALADLEQRLASARAAAAAAATTAAAEEPLGALCYTEQAQAAGQRLLARLDAADASSLTTAGAEVLGLLRRARSSGERDPSHALLAGLGNLCGGDLDKARPALEAAVRASPGDPVPLVLLARWCRARGRADERVAFLERAVLADGARSDSRFELCRALLDRRGPGDRARALSEAPAAVGASVARAARVAALFPEEPGLRATLEAQARANDLKARQSAVLDAPGELKAAARAAPGVPQLREPLMGIVATGGSAPGDGASGGLTLKLPEIPKSTVSGGSRAK